MNKELKKIVDLLASSYGDVQREARGYDGLIEHKHIVEALDKADKASVEYTVLSMLSGYIAKPNADSTE